VPINTLKEPQFTRQKKARQSKYNFKAIMIVFCNIQGIFHVDWVPEGQTVNQINYKEDLTNLLEQVRRRRPEMWKIGSSVLHQNNAPAHKILSVNTFSRSTRSPCWHMHRTHLT
jgi:hypothetical protein